MERKICEPFLTNFIIFNQKFIEKPNKYKMGKYYYKYSPRSEEILKIMDSRKAELSEELYALPDQLLYKRNGEYLGCRVFDYKDMDTIKESLLSQYEIDYLKTFENLTTVIRELESIGISYFDVHHENFLVDKNNNFKAIDLDGAVLKTDITRMSTRYNLMNLVVLVFFYSNFPNITAPLRRILSKKITREVLPKDVFDYLTLINRGSIVDLDRDNFEVIQELEKAAPLILWRK